jgi:predicted transcriptional regulator
VRLKAVIEALLKFMPRSEAEAMTQAELFEKAVIPTKTTGQRALRHLLETGQIQRIGWKGNRFRYFL